MKCKVCSAAGVETDFAGVGEVLKHYKSDHPGQRSPEPHKPRGKKRGPGARTPNAPAATDPVLPLESAPPDPAAGAADELGDEDTNERPPALPPGLEIPPAAPRRKGWREWFGMQPRGDTTPAPTRERRPSRKRESTADMLSAIWGGIGTGMQRFNVDVPTGRCLQYQAPVAGEVLEKLTANTWVDRPLQAIARNTDNAEAAAALFALPALVFAYQRVPPEAYPTLEMLMQEAVRAHMKAMVPVIRKRRARERELAKVVDELKDEGLLDPEVGDVQAAVDFVINSMFATPPPADVDHAPGAPADVDGVRVP
jgi:hypothetical protein